MRRALAGVARGAARLLTAAAPRRLSPPLAAPLPALPRARLSSLAAETRAAARPQPLPQPLPARPPRLFTLVPRGAVWQTLSRPAARAFSTGSALERARGQLSSLQASLPGARVAAQASAAKRLEAWWAAHHRKVYLGAGLLASVVVWRSMFYVASRFLSFSESVAEAGFLALAASLVLALGTYFSWRRHLDPEAVYRRAWAQLQQSQAVQAALGAPLSHTETRAFVMSGGNLRLKGWVPRLRSRRCNLLFPLAGSHGRGIVSAEAKREKGRYVFKLLAVDVAPRAEAGGLGREARLYLAGDEKAYNATRVLAELRDPLIAQLQAEPAQAAEEEGEVLGLTEGEAAAAAAPAVAQARAEAEEDLYAFDHFVRWLKHKRATESRAQ